MGPNLGLAANGMRYLVVALLGCGLALALDPVWELDTRWIAVVFIAIGGVAVALSAARVFSDFLLIVTFFSLPFAAFSKWFWPSELGAEKYGDIVMVGVLGVGLIDFLLVGLYVAWFYRVFVTREQASPRFKAIDVFILWYVLAYLVSLIDCKSPEIALGSTEFLIKHVLFYFYLSRNFEERHLPWLLGALAFTVCLEAPLAAYQFSTGQLLGLALDKGAGSASLAFQNEVPGTEGYHLATGTTYDSHVLGHLMSMIAPFTVVLLFTHGLRPVLKLASLAAGIAAAMVILLTLDRSAWLGTAISLSIGVVLIVALWRERGVVVTLVGFAMMVMLAAPFLADYVYERFARSPIETIWVRFEQYDLALDIFSRFPIFGIGPGNWISVWRDYDFNWFGPENTYNLVHNVILWNAVELGIFGAIPFLFILALPTLTLFALACRRRDVAGRVALAAVIALIASMLHGLLDGVIRDPTVYMMFWILVSLSVALPRLRPGAGDFLMAPLRPRAAVRLAGMAGVPAGIGR